MGQSVWTSILIAIAIFKTKEVQGQYCELSSPGCHNGETNSATIECFDNTDSFLPTVMQKDCFGNLGYYYNNEDDREIYNFDSNFDISVKLYNCYFNYDLFQSMRDVDIYIRTITIEKGNLMSVPPELFSFKNVKSISIVENYLQKICLNTFLGNRDLNKLNVSYNSIAVLEEDTNILKTVSRIVTIDLSHNVIETIPDNYFGHFTQLKYLYLFHNSLTNINILTFEGLSQLQTLDLSYNKILQMGHTFIRFVNLKELSLAYNNLDTITYQNLISMTSLEKLNITANKFIYIEDDAFRSLSSLTELDLANNQISVIGASLFRNNSKLHLLNLSQNSINTIESGAFEGKNITSFFFGHNNLTGPLQHASFEGVYTRTLDLSGGKITSLETEAFRNSHIRSLNLSSNVINSISNTTFRSLNDLVQLDLSNNRISSINFETTALKDLILLNFRKNSITLISKNAFQNLTLLEKLDLSFNYISELQPQLFKDLEKLEILDLKRNNFSHSLEANTFQGLKALSDLQLEFTRIPSFEDEAFSGLDSLRTLNTSHGELTRIGYNTFNNTGVMKIIDLSYNLLENFSINTTSLPLLEELYLNNNKIRSITNNTFLGLVHLVALNLNNNNVLKFDSTVFRNLPNMQTLYLSSNNIREQFNFENVSSTAMKRLDLSSCKIKNANTILICKIQNLEWLNLSANEITFVDKLTFQNMPDLLWLDLSFNLISYIQPGSFLKTNGINLLNLHGNRMSALQYGVLDGPKELQELNLSSNALRSFELSVLHNFPRNISIIALDDNALENIDLYQFLNTTIKVITIGGNPIRCSVFVSFKKYTETHTHINVKITAETLDYHSENVDGIRCYSNSKLSLYNHLLSDTDSDNSKVGLVNKKVIDKIGSKSETTNNLTSILEYIDKHSQTVNKLSNTMDKFMINLNKSHSNLMDKYDKNQTELIIRKNNYHVANDSIHNLMANNNVVLYVMTVCLILILIILMLFIYKFIMPRSSLLCSINRLQSSTQPIANLIEMK